MLAGARLFDVFDIVTHYGDPGMLSFRERVMSDLGGKRTLL